MKKMENFKINNMYIHFTLNIVFTHNLTYENVIYSIQSN
jgi:hypothetical protein